MVGRVLVFDGFGGLILGEWGGFGVLIVGLLRL